MLTIWNTQHTCRFVDGQDYMSAVADAIVNAREEIFITDWQLVASLFLSPHLVICHWLNNSMLLQISGQ